nr:unnamed protein product [Spirometra erinaceieuropaei]
MSSSPLPTPEPPVPTIVWRLMLVGGVLLYSSYTILAHLCEENGKVPFSFMAVVFCIEILKLLLSAFMFLLEVAKGNTRPSAAGESSVSARGSFLSALLERLRAEFSPHPPHDHSPTTPTTAGSSVCRHLLIIAPFAVPAILYTITNNLGLAIQLEMDPATYQVLANFKILSTAILFRLIIKRPISPLRWASLVLILIAGIVNGMSSLDLKGDATASVLHITPKGIFMVTIYCTVSGLAGVYTEYILKHRVHMSLNIQNGLLYIFGSLINGFLFVMDDLKRGGDLNVFHGFSSYAWWLVLTQAISGIFMGFVMKYASNLVRLFIISSAMVVTTLLSVLIFGLVLKLSFVLSALLVCVALVLYHY